MKKLKSITAMLLMILCMASACGQSAPTWQEQYDLGVRYLSEGNYEEAILAFTAAIEIDPNQALAYVGRGDAYAASEETEENLAAAQADYEKAIELDETLAEAYLGLADVYIRRGEFKKVNDILQLCQEKNGADQEIMDRLETLEFELAYEIRESRDWLTFMSDVRDMVDSTFGQDFLTYEQKSATYDPVIEDLELCMIAYPDRAAAGYKYLNKIYLCLNELDKCLEIRGEGYARTGDEELNPEGCTVSDQFGSVTYDAWGREILEESTLPPGYITYTEYGDNKKTKKTTCPDNEDLSSEMEYFYENGRLVSRIYHYGENQTRYDILEYIDDNTCISWSQFTEGGHVYKEAVYTFNEYGKIVREDRYSEWTGEVSETITYE